MSTSFLPEPEATPAPPKKSGKRALALWVALIVMFLAIWQFLTPDSQNHAHSVPPPPPREANASYALWALGTPLAAAVMLIVWFLRLFRVDDAYHLAQEPGRRAMAYHRYAEALGVYLATLQKSSKRPNYKALAQTKVADVQVRLGRLDDALATYAALERSNTMLLRSGVRTHLAARTAFIHALKGDVPLAERWVAECRSRLAKNKDDRFSYGAWLCLAEAVLAIRKGDVAGAARTLDDHVLELRNAMNADTYRTVEILRAFGDAQGGVRASNAMAERLVRVEPVTPGEFAFLGVAWPEMKAFLVAHGLDTGAVAS